MARKINIDYKIPNCYNHNSDKFIPHLYKSYLKEIYSYTDYDLSCHLWSDPTSALTRYLYLHYVGKLFLKDKGLEALLQDIETLKSLGYWDIHIEEYALKEMEAYVEHKAEIKKLSPSDRRLYQKEILKDAEEESFWKL